MCSTRKLGRPVKRIPGRQNGLTSRRIRRYISKRAGFTLIELLMVIAIITMLVAILMPALQRVRNQARAVICQANLKQWGVMMDLYAEENQGHFFGQSDMAGFMLGSLVGGDDDPNHETLNPFDTKGISLCPMATKPGPMFGSKFEAWTFGPGQVCSYGFNFRLLGKSNLSANIFTVKNSAQFPVLLDCTFYYGVAKDNEGPPEVDSLNSGGDWNAFCMNRHSGYINGVFLDWSVRKIGLKELWTLKWYRNFDTANPWTRASGIQPEDWPEWMRRFKDY